MRVQAGVCNLEPIPAQLRLELSDHDAAALIELVRTWLEGTAEPAIFWSSGVAFAKTADDSGAGPPYPLAMNAQSLLACGLQASWLRSHLARELTRRSRTDPGVACQHNVCCWPAAGEFDSSGSVIFGNGADESAAWVLRAAAVVADNGAMTKDMAARHRADVRKELESDSQRTCPGEPLHPFGR
jgi:hypothetical protein